MRTSNSKVSVVIHNVTDFTLLIITITISSNVTGALAALFFNSHSVQLWSDNIIAQLAVIGQLKQHHTKSAQLNPPITELILITMTTTLILKKKTGEISKME